MKDYFKFALGILGIVFITPILVLGFITWAMFLTRFFGFV